MKVGDLHIDTPTTSVGSLYLAGFAQVGAPHAGLIIAGEDGSNGHFVHINIKNGIWAFDARTQNIAGSMSLTTLVRIHDASAGTITEQELEDAARKVAVPAGGESGECLPWVLRVIERLDAEGLVSLSSSEALREEFTDFATGNRKYANRNQYPNVKTSLNCT
ncbi:hypothetical protein FPV67DRAFT_1778478 [Lyophyllum atratum]|nr:hypothetical protein FPV67DRAFT_1778478 [Lyophyllum atratum]